MGYEVRFDALDAMVGAINSGVTAWNSQLEGTYGSVNVMTESDSMMGAGADNIRQYLTFVHGLITESFTSLLQAQQTNSLLYKTDYQTNIDQGLHTVILEDELNDIKIRTRAKQNEAGTADEAVRAALSGISDLCILYFGGCGSSDNAYDGLVRHMNNLDTAIQNMESRHMDRDFATTQVMIRSLSALLDEQIAKGRRYKSSFSVESWAQGENLQALIEAMEAQAQIREGQQEALQIAIAHEEDRAAEMQREFEELQEKANREKIALAVGCLVVSAVVLIGTGGAGTPLVVGAVSGISGAVMAGGNTYIDQKYSGGEYDWGEIGKSAFVGGISGFIAGYAGAGITKSITTSIQGTVIGRATTQSLHTGIRMLSYGTINGTAQVTAGTLSRFAGTTIATGDIGKGWDSAVNKESMVMDGIIGFVSGAAEGIKSPGSHMTEADQKKLEGWDRAPDKDSYMRYKRTYDNPDFFDQTSGKIKWPKNDGAEGAWEDIILKKGTIIDRYGAKDGSFFSPDGTPFDKRALPPGDERNLPYRRYVVQEDFEVRVSKVAPWFDRPGGGTQYYIQEGTDEVLNRGVIEMIQERLPSFHFNP